MFILNDRNFVKYAMRNYTNPACASVDDFQEDLNRIKYIKRLLKKYHTTGTLRERLILNHIIVFYNVFGPIPATNMILYRIDPKYYADLKTFLVYLSLIDEEWIIRQEKNSIRIVDIPVNPDIANILRSLDHEANYG